MLKPINNGVFVFLFSIIYSLIEIEMEGKNGWCTHLPTAKNVISTFTLYHLLMMVLIILTFYQQFNNKDVWLIVFYITMFFFIEDLLWFVLNPYYTIKKYSEKNIPWHSKWFWGQPIENFFCYFIIFITYFNTKYKKEHMNSFIYILLYLNSFLGLFYFQKDQLFLLPLTAIY